MVRPGRPCQSAARRRTDRGTIRVRRARAAPTALARPAPCATMPRQPKSAYQEWRRDRPVEATTTYRRDAGKVPNPGRSSCEIRELPETLPPQEGSSRLRSRARPASRGSPHEGPTDDDRAAGHPDDPIAAVRHAHGRRAPSPGRRRIASAAHPRPALSQLRPRRGARAQLRLRRLLRAARGRLRPRGRGADARPRRRSPRARPASGATSSCCPSTRAADARPAVGSTPLVAAERLGQAIGIERLWLKDDTRNPTLSFKDRAVAIAAARAVEFGLEALACASTGNLAGATAAAAAALGLPAYVFVPADLEPAKIDHALAYGATVVPSTAPTTTSTGSASRSPTSSAGASSTSTCARSTPRAARRSPSRSPSSSAGACPTSSSRRSPRARCSRSWPRASTSWPRSG